MRALLDGVGSRGAIRQVGEYIDRHPDSELRAMLLATARQRDPDLPDDAATWPGKRLVRAALGRESRARVPRNPTHLDEGFTCAHCRREVPPHGGTPRDHCPRCLRSLHVDVVPGDRAAACGGVMDPVGMAIRGGDPVIAYRCRACGTERTNRAATGGTEPDDAGVLVRLSRGELV
jgi:hypothetical protein